MRKHHPKNERIKRQYFTFLKEAKRLDESSVDAVAKALSRFETYTGHKDFKAYHYQQAVAFKQNLAKQKNQHTQKPLSKSTMNATLRHLKAFFQWLSMQSGYKSRISYCDAEYFNLSEKDTRIATAKRQKPVPTIEQIKHVISSMPAGTVLEKRNRCLLAFTLATGARDSAIASMKLKHVDLEAGCVFQDAREVNTKASKTFTTTFFPVGDEVIAIIREWVSYLRTKRLWGNDDPLFPKTAVEVGDSHSFQAKDVIREHWSTASPIRKIFKEAFESAGLPYFNPHSFRNTLATLGEAICKSPEQFKAWSQNLGHEKVLTTFCAYGEVQPCRQAELIQQLTVPSELPNEIINASDIAQVVAYEIKKYL